MNMHLFVDYCIFIYYTIVWHTFFSDLFIMSSHLCFPHKKRWPSCGFQGLLENLSQKWRDSKAQEAEWQGACQDLMLDMVRASKSCHGSSRGGSPRSAPWHRTGCSPSIPWMKCEKLFFSDNAALRMHHGIVKQELPRHISLATVDGSDLAFTG